MKMESAKLCGLLAVGILLLILWTDPTAACMCMGRLPVDAYCQSDFAVKAQVLDAVDNPDRFERRYKINVLKVYKGSDTLKRFRTLFTASMESLCGYEHPAPFNRDEYIITGRRNVDRLTTTLCHFNRKWNSLSYAVKKGFEGGYKYHCY